MFIEFLIIPLKQASWARWAAHCFVSPLPLGILGSQKDGGRSILEHKAFLIQRGRGTLSRVQLSSVQQLVLVKKRSPWDPEPQDISRRTLLSKVGQQVSFIFAS